MCVPDLPIGSIETEDCNSECPVDCVGDWGVFGECSQSCGGGIQTRTYEITEQAINGGNCINENAEESIVCNENPCPIDCEGEWSEWEECSATGGGRTQIRNYIIK